MKTRYSSLVSVKKNIVQKSELAFSIANTHLENARKALELSYQLLREIKTPSSGNMPEFLSARMLLDAQRDMIKHNEEWVLFSQQELSNAKEQLKIDTLEYEKFNYLEVQEIKAEIKKQKIQENKDLDEVALMTYDTTNKRKVS